MSIVLPPECERHLLELAKAGRTVKVELDMHQGEIRVWKVTESFRPKPA